MNLLSFCKKEIVIIIIALLITLSSITGFVRLSSFTYYLGIGLFAFFMLLNVSQIRVHSKYIVLFLLACFLSILFNSPPEYFRAWQRFGVYLFILLIMSPVFVSNTTNFCRLRLLNIQLLLCAVLSIGSFFAFFLGINFFIRNNEVLEIRSGSFSGFFNHSMVLGPIAGISTIYLMSLIFNDNLKKYRKYLIVGMICCLGATLLSASRMAIVSTLFGCLVSLFCYYKENIYKYLKKIIVIIVLSVSTFPIWGGLTDFVMEKQNNNIKSGSMLYSRSSKIEARLNEFEDSPIFGIGFASVNPKYDKVNKVTGQVEPGSSWLAVLSMIGILGLFPFLSIIIVFLKKSFQLKNKYYSMLFTGILVFFIFHMIAEGYILAPGSFINLFFWLLLGAIYAVDYKEKYNS